MTSITKAAQQAHTPEHIAGVDHAHELLRRMGYHRDGDWFIHANRRGAEAIHISTISTIVNAGQMALTQRPAAQTEREANATARAFSLATMAAEEFVRCNGLSTGEPDEFMMTGPDLTDEHATACVDHLKWGGECVAFDTDDGVLVRLGDFTLGSLS